MSPSKSGNQVLDETLDTMDELGLRGKIYCHPIGDYGHSAGSLIGMTNLQDGVPVLGDLKILAKSYYSIELSATHYVPSWGVDVSFMQEEDVYWSEKSKKWEWVKGRQEKFHLVRTSGVNGGRRS